MPEEAKLNFYSINRCGYYRHGTQEAILGNLPGVLTQLRTWATRPGFPLESTCTFSLNENGGDSLRVFCFDILANNANGDCFLTTWNETPSSKGKVPSVTGNQPVGAAEVHLNEIEEGTIPGYATYFWLIPELNVFSTIRFQHLLNGQQNLVRYLNGFLEKHSDHAVINQVDGDTAEIIGYREDILSEVQELYPSFRAKLLRKSGEVDLIRQKRANIRKLIRKSTLDLQIEEEQSLMRSLLQKLGIIQGENNGNQKLNVKYSFPYTPSADEINSIIENAFEEGMSWTNDVGFQFVGKSEIIWLSNSIVKRDINLNIERDNDEIVNLTSLATQLTAQRNVIANIVNGN
ncbi:MAG: hypothetical protein Q8R88_06670 [Desulfoprunum sp.]|nr:hypothetical protein [Desulfoprunum sp.]